MTTRDRRHRGLRNAWRFLVLATAIILGACGPSDTAEIVTELHVYPNVSWYVPPSLEEQIYRSTVIVRASLQSATAATAAMSEGGHHAVQELRFTAHEYLKGSGPTTLAVSVRGDRAHETEASARAAAADAVARRVTTWDDRQGVLFLSPQRSGSGASGASGASLTFTVSNPNQSPWDYSVNTLSRAWLPGRDAQGAGGASGTSDPVFITDGAASPPSVVSLTDLRAKITSLAAELQAGAGTAGYERCVRGRILHERVNRADAWTPSGPNVPLSSGAEAGTELYKETNYYRDPQYNRFWLSGPDHARFQARIIDDDDQASTGYDHTLATARPLPTGSYQVHYNEQHHTNFPCDFVPDDAYTLVSVQVTAAAGTVHEAFFDPVAIGNGVGADWSHGALEPTAFTVGETAVSLQRLSWEGRQLQLELSAAVDAGGPLPGPHRAGRLRGPAAVAGRRDHRRHRG